MSIADGDDAVREAAYAYRPERKSGRRQARDREDDADGGSAPDHR